MNAYKTLKNEKPPAKNYGLHCHSTGRKQTGDLEAPNQQWIDRIAS